MKNKVSIINILIVLGVLLSVSATVGCSGDRGNFNVSGQTTDATDNIYFLSSIQEIEDLVTDDNKLVINYFDAYTWIVFFDDESKVQSMIYIYEFPDEKEAESMVSVRNQELAKNKTMTINEAYNVGHFVVISLTDTSFTNVSRSILENNFNGLIVY